MTPGQNNTPQELSSWKRSTYLLGVLFGAVFGLVTAYLYARAAEEDAEKRGGKPDAVPTRQLLGLGLSGLGLVRQITELGKPDKK